MFQVTYIEFRAIAQYLCLNLDLRFLIYGSHKHFLLTLEDHFEFKINNHSCSSLYLHGELKKCMNLKYVTHICTLLFITSKAQSLTCNPTTEGTRT